jgi:hypothetical protein
MDRWAWDQLDPWLEIRRELPIGAVLCVVHGPTAGRRWEASAARKQLHHAAARAGVRRVRQGSSSSRILGFHFAPASRFRMPRRLCASTTCRCAA